MLSEESRPHGGQTVNTKTIDEMEDALIVGLHRMKPSLGWPGFWRRLCSPADARRSKYEAKAIVALADELYWKLIYIQKTDSWSSIDGKIQWTEKIRAKISKDYSKMW